MSNHFPTKNEYFWGLLHKCKCAPKEKTCFMLNMLINLKKLKHFHENLYYKPWNNRKPCKYQKGANMRVTASFYSGGTISWFKWPKMEEIVVSIIKMTLRVIQYDRRTKWLNGSQNEGYYLLLKVMKTRQFDWLAKCIQKYFIILKSCSDLIK